MIATASRVAGLTGPARDVLIGRLVALGAGVGTALLASRILGPEGRGVVVGFATLQFLVASSFSLGTGSATYLLASRRDLTPGSLAGANIVIAAGIGAVAGILSAIGIALGAADAVAPGLPWGVILLLGPAAAAQYLTLAMTQLAMGTARGGVTTLLLATAPVLLLTATPAAGMSGGGAPAMVAAYAAAWMVAAGIAAWLAAGRPTFVTGSVSRLLRAGAPAAAGDVANALSYRSDVVVLALLAGPSAVGVYALAVQAMEPLWLLANSAAGGLLISLPGERPDAWRAMTTRATLRIAIVTAVGAVAVVGMMPVLVAIAGPGFGDAPLVAAVLAPAVVFLAVSKTLAAAQLARGHLWVGTMVSAISLVVNLAANSLLVPRLGGVGAALGSVVSYGLSAILWVRALRRP